MLAPCVQVRLGSPSVGTPRAQTQGRELPAELALLCLSVMASPGLAEPSSLFLTLLCSAALLTAVWGCQSTLGRDTVKVKLQMELWPCACAQPVPGYRNEPQHHSPHSLAASQHSTAQALFLYVCS